MIDLDDLPQLIEDARIALSDESRALQPDPAAISDARMDLGRLLALQAILEGLKRLIEAGDLQGVRALGQAASSEEIRRLAAAQELVWGAGCR